MFYQKKSVMFYSVQQPIEHSLVKIKFMSKTLLHYVIPNSNTHLLG